MPLFHFKLIWLLVAMQTTSSCSAEPDALQRYQLESLGHGVRCIDIVHFVNWDVYSSQNGHQGPPMTLFTNAVYAFMAVDVDGTVYTEDTDTSLEKFDVGNSWLEDSSDAFRCTEQRNLIRQADQDAKPMLSIGGRVWSTGFAIIASKANTRTTFARSAVSLLKNWDFNGIDIDWKLPGNEDDVANMVLLLEAIRGGLDSVSSNDHLDLSIVALVGLEYSDKLPEGTGNLDRIDLMACDYAEPWSFEAGYGSDLDPSVEEFDSTQLDIEDTVHGYLEAGVPMEKLTLGLPNWRSWQRTSELDISFLEPTLVKWENAIQGHSALASTLAFEHASKAHPHMFGAIPIGGPAETRWQQPVFPAIAELS